MKYFSIFVIFYCTTNYNMFIFPDKQKLLALEENGDDKNLNMTKIGTKKQTQQAQD